MRRLDSTHGSLSLKKKDSRQHTTNPEDTDEPENSHRYFFTCANYCGGLNGYHPRSDSPHDTLATGNKRSRKEGTMNAAEIAGSLYLKSREDQEIALTYLGRFI